MHDLAMLEVLSTGETLCQCLCGAISGQQNKADRWFITPNGDGTAAVSPSINWPGHFHTTFTRAPLGKVDWDRYVDSPSWALEHPGHPTQ